MPCVIDRTSSMASHLLLCLAAGWCGAAAAQPAPTDLPAFRPGAYADRFGSTGTVCVTPQHLAALTSAAWQQSMAARGMACTLTETERPMPGYERWQARCTPAPAGAADGSAQLYKVTVHASGNMLVLDAGMTQDGRQVMKTAFVGDYREACAPGTPPLDVRAYLEPSALIDPGAAAVRKAVAADLIRCAGVFNGLSLSVAPPRKEALRAAAAGLLEAAVQLHPGDANFHLDTVKKSATEVSAELVGSSAEKKFAVYQTCSPYLEPGSIEKAVQQRAAATPAAR